MDNLLSTKEAAQILNVKPATLERWRNRKLFGVPFFTADVKRGNTWYYDRERVEQLKAVYQPGILQDMYKLAFLNPEAEDTPDGDFQKTTTSRETPAPYFQKTTTSLQARQFGVPRHRGYYSTAQVAEMFSVTARTVQQWVERGVLRWDRYDHANKWLFAQTTIKNFAARRLHNSNYGLPTLFKEMNDMTNEAVNALEVDAKAAADEVFGNGENAIPVDADNTHAAQDGAHATIDSNDVEPVTQKEFYAWCTLVDKIRDGQLNCVNRLSRELQAAGIVTDRNQLIELAKTCRHNYNEFRVWLSQFNLDFTDDKTGELQRLVVHEDGNAYFEGVVDSVHVTLTVDEEFQSLIPPLSDDERRQLEENILQDGIRDPLVVWQGHGIIVDGHNRYSIATKHGLPFKTREIAFTDRDAVKLWIVQNQFGRRNVNRYSRGELALKLEPTYAAQAKANQQLSDGRGKKGLANLPNLNTRDELAKIAGVSSRLMAMIQYLVEAASDEVKVALRADELTINRACSAVKAGAVTVEDVLNFKPDRKTESPSPKPPEPAREVDSSPVEVQDEPPHARDDEPTVDSMDNDGGNGEVVGGEVKRICRGKVAAFDVIGDDDDQCDDTPAQIVDTSDDVQDSSGDATRNEINALLARVVELILDADDDALTITKAGLAGIVAALKKNVARVKIDSARKTIATDGISVCNPPKEA